VEELKEVFAKHPGLIENMNFRCQDLFATVAADGTGAVVVMGAAAK
jgi:hypothetical protein